MARDHAAYQRAYRQRRPDVAKAAQMKYRYGLTASAYASMLRGQNGRCAGCETPLDGGRKTHIDHDHDSGKVRGLLCQPCNHALGQVKDSAQTLRRLADYVGASRD